MNRTLREVCAARIGGRARVRLHRFVPAGTPRSGELLAQRCRQGFDSDRAAVVVIDDHCEIASVHLVEARIVDLETGKLAGQFEFTSGVDEIFDVTVLAGSASTALHGPHAGEDGEKTIWSVPRPGSSLT